MADARSRRSKGRVEGRRLHSEFVRNSSLTLSSRVRLIEAASSDMFPEEVAEDVIHEYALVMYSVIVANAHIRHQ
jgi:hypothetical protein